MNAFDPYQVFQRSAERFPDRAALTIGDRTWTYAELEQQASLIAGWCDRYAPSGARIALHGCKDLPAYAGILGILRSGRSYVPLHPDHPAERWRTVLERSGAAACIAAPSAHSALAGIMGIPLWREGECTEDGPVRTGAEAYVMFTSGSTGGPKGVPVLRSNVAAYLEHLPGRYDLNEHDRFSQLFALTFDLSVHDMFVCWSVGGCLCIPEVDAALRVPSYITSAGITVWFSVPSLITVMKRMRVLRPGSFPLVRRSFFCGEALPWNAVDEWRVAAPNSGLANLYGPTEATIAISVFDIGKNDAPRSGIVPLGRAIGTDRMRVQGDQGAHEGELMLSGPQVTTGYLNAPEATARAFIRSEGDGRMWYRTGDIVRIDGNGDHHFLGRTDDQVKILGHRVEPGEVDAMLAGLLPHGTSLTLAADLGGTTRLVTFIDVAMDAAPLLVHLRSELPSYMVPERIVVVDGFPLTAHGKVDRTVLLQAIGNG